MNWEGNAKYSFCELTNSVKQRGAWFPGIRQESDGSQALRTKWVYADVKRLLCESFEAQLNGIKF